jgi:hypothetical protein
MPHHHKSLRPAAGLFRLRLQAVSCLLAACCCLLYATPAAATQPLPPFHIDTTLPQDIVINAEQGLGQCHYIEAGILTLPYVSWGYDAGETASAWVSIEPEPGAFNWTPLDAEVNKARDLDKHIWLELLTSEGQTPQWARDAGVVLVGSRGGTPAPWNEAYQRLLRRAVHAMAARYDDDPTVDAINMMAGGCYGEMAICASEMDAAAWEQAGYTDDRFIEAAKQIIDIYLEEEHQWEDGSTSHGFRKTPVVLQLGGGLYGHTAAVIRPVVEYAVAKYGMRVWLKYNGLGSNYNMGWLYPEYSTVTRVGYEPAGTSPELMSQPTDYVQAALDHHASYLCLQKMYFTAPEQEWQEARELAARYLGAQIVLQGLEAPAQVEAGQEYTFVTNWTNRGTVPLMRAERQGIRDVPASYDIWLGFVNRTSGATLFEQTLTPSVPTTDWYTAQAVRIEQAITIPTSLPSGDYDLMIALVNPKVAPGEKTHRFRLVSSAPDDGTGRYAAARIAVRGGSPAPAGTATPQGTSPATGSWLTRLWRAIAEWLRNLFR